MISVNEASAFAVDEEITLYLLVPRGNRSSRWHAQLASVINQAKASPFKDRTTLKCRRGKVFESRQLNSAIHNVVKVVVPGTLSVVQVLPFVA